ncbi:GUN4 domain-containing protein [Phormidesmis priestleyi]
MTEQPPDEKRTEKESLNNQIARTTLLDRLSRYLTEQGESIDAKEFLEQVVQISELLVEQEPEEFEFAHLSFQEYLAAVQIVQRKQECLLYEQLTDDRWKPTILLYVGLIKNPTALIQEAMQRGATDFAYLCFREATKAIDPALKLQLTALKASVETSQYQKLEEYLSSGQWEAADNETYRLMITTVGKEEGQWFEPEELLNFPCEALKAIDGLWVKHSNGHFGFSVQKKIYLECDGIPDGQYCEEAWNKFCHANGWRVNEKSDVIYDTSSPEGHLPEMYISYIVVARDFLFRIETCKV